MCHHDCWNTGVLLTSSSVSSLYSGGHFFWRISSFWPFSTRSSLTSSHGSSWFNQRNVKPSFVIHRINLKSWSSLKMIYLFSNNGDFRETSGQWGTDALLCQSVSQCLQIISTCLRKKILVRGTAAWLSPTRRGYEKKCPVLPSLQCQVLHCAEPSSLCSQLSQPQRRQRPRGA